MSSSDPFYLYAEMKLSYDEGGDLEMKVIGDSLSFSTGGFNDMKDLTGEVSKKLLEKGLQNGIVNLFVPGSTGGLTTIEYESGL